jgi:hypothetical protein
MGWFYVQNLVALDAVMTFCLHIYHHWRRASDAHH